MTYTYTIEAYNGASWEPVMRMTDRISAFRELTKACHPPRPGTIARLIVSVTAS